MRRGRTVEIKTSSATAWTGSICNSAFRKSAGKLFHTLVAAAEKVVSPKQLYVRWTDSVLVSAECSSFARASVTSWQSSARYGKSGQGPVDERRYLKHHALPDRRPVQLTKHWWNMVGFCRICWTLHSVYSDRKSLQIGYKLLQSYRQISACKFKKTVHIK